MSGGRRPTWRWVEDERIAGTWRHAWVRNGERFWLTDLVVYADGIVDCHGLTSVEEFAARARAGDVLAGAPDASRRLSAEDFVAEVRDDIEWLNRRPLAETRCMDAAEAFAREPSEENRAILRAAYEEVPHRDGIYAFTGEGPFHTTDIRVLVAGPGNEAETLSGVETVTEAMQQDAVGHLLRNRALSRLPRQPPDGPDEPVRPSVILTTRYRGQGEVKPPNVHVLRNEHPAAIEVAGRTFPSVDRAYLALSLADPAARAEVAGTADWEVIAEAHNAPRREGWPAMRTAVMADLLRAKFARHPELAAVLSDTGDARIVYEGVDRFWSQTDRKGRNWSGRLLEQIRAERAAAGVVFDIRGGRYGSDG
jgi:predicted NAD-dependent protein-ADP-ribosyltransferase YbiA (DUF1768 family)